MLSDLAPQTTYEVVLIPESNVHYFPSQSTRVTTLAGKKKKKKNLGTSLLGDKDMIPASCLRLQVEMEDAGVT